MHLLLTHTSHNRFPDSLEFYNCEPICYLWIINPFGLIVLFLTITKIAITILV